MKVAAKSHLFAGRQLSHAQKKMFGAFAHYSFGILQVAFCGAMAHLSERGEVSNRVTRISF
jgi:hypothetical protein